MRLLGGGRCVEARYVPGALKANRELAGCAAKFDEGVYDELQTMSSIRNVRRAAHSRQRRRRREPGSDLRVENFPAALIGEVVERAVR